MSVRANIGAERYDRLISQLRENYNRRKNLLLSSLLQDGRPPLTAESTPEKKLETLNYLLLTPGGKQEFRLRLEQIYSGQSNLEDIISKASQKAQDERFKLMAQLGKTPYDFSREILFGKDLDVRDIL
jgi:hypothetical protein